MQGEVVYTGFIHVQNLEKKTIEKILVVRVAHGPFLGLEDFIERTCVDIEQLNILIRVGALGFTGKGKKELLWLANFQRKRMDKQPVTAALFGAEPVRFVLPDFPKKPFEDAYDEIELLGFPLCNSFQLADDQREGLVYAKDLTLFKNKQVTLLGKLVTVKDVKTVKGQIMSFGTFLDEDGDWLDTVHFPESRNRFPFQGGGFYKITGKVVEEFGVYSVEVSSLKPVGLRTG